MAEDSASIRFLLHQILEQEDYMVRESPDGIPTAAVFEAEHSVIMRGKREWEATFDAVSDMILLTDIQGIIIRCNRAVIQHFDLTYADVLGRHIEDLFLDNSTPKAALLFKQSSQTQFSSKGSWLETRMYPTCVEGGLQGLVYVVKDITDRKRAEEELQHQRDFAVQVMNAMGQGLIVIDDTWRFEYVNPAFARMLGHAPEALLGKMVWDIVSPEEERLARAKEHQPRRLGQAGNYEIHLQHADGSLIDVLITSTPRWQNGQMAGAIVVVTDLTGRKQAEEALRLSEERLQLVKHATNDAVWDLNLSTGERWWNKGVRSLFGYTPDHIVQDQVWWEGQIHPDDRAKVLASFQAALSGEEQFWSKEYRFRRLDGTYAYIFDRGYITQDEHGKPQRVIGAMMDISERKRVEEALVKSEELFSKAFQSSPIPMAITSVENGLLIDVNKGWEKLFGYDRREVIGRQIRDLNIYANPDESAGFAQQLEEEGKVDDFSVRTKTRSGEERRLLMSAQMVEIHNQACLLSTLYDITERQRLQEAMMTSQKLADLGTLAAGIAHEINSPLQVITGLSDSLILRLGQAINNPDFLRQRLETIKRNGWRTAEIVRALLTYSRSSAAEAEANELNAVIRDSLLLVEHQLRSWSHINIVTELADNLPLIICDPNQITQVLINLLSNARDAMPEGGKVIIRTAFEHEINYVCLSVGDNGVGIPSQIQSRIFDPFYTTKPIGKGTGLGLSIVAGIMRAHGGRIELESETGRGTTFSLYFPVSEVATANILPTRMPFTSGRFDDSSSSEPKDVRPSLSNGNVLSSA